MSRKVYAYYYNQKPDFCQVREELAKWLSSYRWDWFFTGTFKDEKISKIGIQHSFFSFLNHIAEKENCYPLFFYCLEIHKYRVIPHIHSIIKFNFKVDPKRTIICKDWWNWWFDRYGRNRIEIYNEKLGAGYYLSKYVYKPDKVVHWDTILTLNDWLEIRRNYLNYKENLEIN